MKRMTARYINECVDKRNGMEVTDQYGTVWGWVYDRHKNIGKWAPRGTHDERVNLIAVGFGVEELRPIYEPYHYTNEFERSRSRHPAMIHWQRREAALASEGVPRLSWWQRFKKRTRHATFRMIWRY